MSAPPVSTDNPLSVAQDFGDNLRQARLAREFTQAEVARRMVELGHRTWRRDTVGQVESATRSVRLDEAIALCIATGHTLKQLLPAWAVMVGGLDSA